MCWPGSERSDTLCKEGSVTLNPKLEGGGCAEGGGQTFWGGKTTGNEAPPGPVLGTVIVAILGWADSHAEAGCGVAQLSRTATPARGRGEAEMAQF
jgi:hypothetical protein